ncbi:unnamed protein product [Mytilus edulis]|uniref:Uncharacterized protein n=1 Tax=Mytilus edulis TaxID=6550 RepID=A0A8S3QYV9_MYTED|nr:unnamed protein product [Mytilus edulis]
MATLLKLNTTTTVSINLEKHSMDEEYTYSSDLFEDLVVRQSSKEVLNQIPDDKSVFNFTKTKEGTKSRKNLTVEELITNLKMLVRQSIVRDNLDESDKHVLVGKRVKHRFDTNGEDQWYTGKVISQVPAFPEWFNIVYDEDSAVYTYHHLDDDLSRADLVILI